MNNLQDELRNRAGERTTMLSASSRFADAAEIYLAKIAERRENSTYDTYRHWMDNVVLPALGELRIHECDVAQLDAYFTTLQRRGYAANTRRTLRTIVAGTMQQAVLHKAAPSNPVRELARIGEPKGKRKAQPQALTIEERRHLLGWLDGTSNDPKVARKQTVARAADLPDLIRFALGTGLRISEVCGVRICDLDLDGMPVVSGDDIRLVPIVAVRGKVCYIKGKGLVRSGTGKTSSALRVIPLPGFVTDRPTGGRLRGLPRVSALARIKSRATEVGRPGAIRDAGELPSFWSVGYKGEAALRWWIDAQARRGWRATAVAETSPIHLQYINCSRRVQ